MKLNSNLIHLIILKKILECLFILNSEFIRGTFGFKNEIDKIFFNELISQNLCRIDKVKENIAINEDYIYSCENNKFMQEKIKEFPTLNF